MKTHDKIMSALSTFLLQIYNRRLDYYHIAIPRERFFNLIFFIFQKNLMTNVSGENAKGITFISSDGLLLQHNKLATLYIEERSFPPILILDDLIVHGRHIGKLLFQLEQAIILDIQNIKGKPLSADEKEQISTQLATAIDIQAFAQSRYPLLLSDRYALKVKSEHRLYMDEIHAVSNFITQITNPLHISSSCNTISIQSRIDSGTLLALLCETSYWERVPWTAQHIQGNPTIYNFIHAHSDKDGIYLLSTIRFYGGDNPVIACTPIFDGVSLKHQTSEQFADTFQEIAEVLSASDEDYSTLYKILTDENKFSLPAKGNLVTALLSITDLIDFYYSNELITKGLVLPRDIVKLAMHYGQDTHKDFYNLVNNESLREDVAAVIREGLRHYASPLPLSPSIPQEGVVTTNEKIEQMVYRMGIQSEKEASCYRQAPFLYKEGNFANYVPQKDGSYVSSFSDYLKGCCEGKLPGLEWVAAYLAHIDNGYITPEFQYDESTGVLHSVFRAGEQSLSYLPKRLSVFLPALSLVEKNAPMLNMTERDTVGKFVKTYLSYSGCKEVEARLLDLKTHIDEYLDAIHESDQLFSGWNISALTEQKDEACRGVQKEFVNQANKFINM